MNLRLEPLARETVAGQADSTGGAWSNWSRMPASATAAWGGSPPASSTPWRRCRFRPWATACATSTASSARTIRDGWQRRTAR
ncbi:MAG: hypothetical protein MZW92_64880 [Comamonadaceae bacterium]|nr:hypothetical protein [Comamonadaceae bacterium]